MRIAPFNSMIPIFGHCVTAASLMVSLSLTYFTSL